MSLPPSGNIREFPLPILLQDLQQRKATGGLIVRRGKVERCVYVKSGQIIFAVARDGDDRLGEVLVKAGLLSRDHLEAAQKVYQRDAGTKKLGAILVENGFVSPKDLFFGLKTQVKDILYSLFLWDDAEYRFEDRLLADILHLQFDIPDLIAEFIERMKQEA